MKYDFKNVSPQLTKKSYEQKTKQKKPVFKDRAEKQLEHTRLIIQEIR